MISDWKACLLQRAGEWGLPQSGEWSFLFYNNYHPHCSDLDVLWFHESEDVPRVVTKICRERGRPEREFQNLQQVHAVASRWAPRPLHFGPQGKFWTLWMQGVPGTRLKNKPDDADLRSMVETVAAIHDAVALPAGRRDPGRYRESVVEPLRILREFGASAAVAEGCGRVLERATEGWIDALRVIPQHGDLYDGNLLRHSGGWYVVDWESFGMVDLPAYDLYTLLLSLLLADGDTCRKWRPELVALVPRVVDSYREKMRLGAADVALLLPLALANWFYIQWRDGRAEFLRKLYPVIADYFDCRTRWEVVFFPKGSA